MTRIRYSNGARPRPSKAELAHAVALAALESRQAPIRALDKETKPRDPYLIALGHRVDPNRVETVLKTTKWVKDLAVTARGSGRDRRVVCFVVMEPGRLLSDVYSDLVSISNLKLKAWARPAAYTQVQTIPRDPVLGIIDRARIGRGKFDGRHFQTTGQYKGRSILITAIIRDAINEIRFEGVVARQPDTRRDSDPVGTVRDQYVRVTLSHKLPGASSKVTATFHFRGRISSRAKSLKIGERILVTAKIESAWRGGYIATDFERVPGEVERVNLRSTASVIEALL